jgi:hypothetical protein
MNGLLAKVPLLAAGAAAGYMIRRFGHRRGRTSPSSPDPAARWLAVTVDVPPEEIRSGGRLKRLLDMPGLDVRLTSARGGTATVIAARPPRSAATGWTGLASRIAGNDPRQPVRRALREAKSILETGEVLRTDAAPPRSVGGGLVAALARRSGGEGRL